MLRGAARISRLGSWTHMIPIGSRAPVMITDLGYIMCPGSWHLIITEYHLQAGTSAAPSEDHFITVSEQHLLMVKQVTGPGDPMVMCLLPQLLCSKMGPLGCHHQEKDTLQRTIDLPAGILERGSWSRESVIPAVPQPGAEWSAYAADLHKLEINPYCMPLRLSACVLHRILWQ